MDLSPLLAAPPVIQLHVIAAVAALLLGALQLFRRKGDVRHRLLGRIWVGLMVVVALSSFFIWTIRIWGPFSPIHLLSVMVLVLLWRGVEHARRQRIAAHRRIMQGTYLLGLIVTGLFTFYPGRTMYFVAFGANGATPAKIALFVAGLAIAGALTLAVLRWRRTGRGSRFIAAH